MGDCEHAQILVESPAGLDPGRLSRGVRWDLGGPGLAGMVRLARRTGGLNRLVQMLQCAAANHRSEVALGRSPPHPLRIAGVCLFRGVSMSQSIQSNDSGFSVSTNLGKVAGLRLLYVQHSTEWWEAEPGVWRPEEFTINVTDPPSLRTCSVILSRDEAAALSRWLTEKLT